MNSFQQRAPRLNLSFPLAFTAEGTTVRGSCLNVSQSGLLGCFDRELELWARGDLLLHFGENAYQLAARVARVNDNEAGLSFLVRDEADRTAISAIVAFATQKTHLTGPPPF